MFHFGDVSNHGALGIPCIDSATDELVLKIQLTMFNISLTPTALKAVSMLDRSGSRGGHNEVDQVSAFIRSSKMRF